MCTVITFYSCPLATFMIQICELYSITIFGHRIQINLNSMILLEFPKKDRAKKTKNQRRVFYTLISIAKSTLFSLYYNRSGKITESRVCKLFCVNLAKTRAVLPAVPKHDFKSILDFEFNPSIHKSIKFFLQQEQYNIRRIQNSLLFLDPWRTFPCPWHTSPWPLMHFSLTWRTYFSELKKSKQIVKEKYKIIFENALYLKIFIRF